MKAKVTGEAGVQFEGKTYGKGEEVNAPKEQIQIWENLDLVKQVAGNSAAAKSAAKGQTVSASKKAANKGQANAASKKAANADRKANKPGETFEPIDVTE